MDFDVLDTLLAPLDGLHMRADTRLIHVPGFARVEAPSAPESWRNEFVQVNATGWDHQTPFVDRLLADLQWSLETGTHRMFLARIDGEPVGMSAWVPRHRGPGYLSGGMVLPAFRGRGVYRALIQARFDDMAALGQGRAVTLSRAHTSGPILSGLGLTPLFRYPIFELPAPGDSG